MEKSAQKFDWNIRRKIQESKQRGLNVVLNLWCSLFKQYLNDFGRNVNNF